MTVATEVWGIEKWMSEQHFWILDPEAGLFTDWDLVSKEVSGRNQAERRRRQAQHEQQYQERLIAWRVAADAFQAVGTRPALVLPPTKPQQTRYIHTDTYRVSRSIQVYSRA